MTARLTVNGHDFNSEGELSLYLQMTDRCIDVLTQYRFSPRKWMFDFAIPSAMLAVEVEGATWVNGGHNRGKGYEDNCRKYNAAVKMGWKVLRFTTDMVFSLEAINTIVSILEHEESMEIPANVVQ